MSHSQILIQVCTHLTTLAVVVGCACLLFPASCAAQSQPQPPASFSAPAWQPPVTKAPAVETRTEMVDLKPPRDIFTQSSPQPQANIAARSLNEAWPRPLPSASTNSNFNLQNTMSEGFGASIAKANLELPSATDRLSGLAENATEKLGDAKDWMQSQTASFLDSVDSDGSTEGGILERLSSMLGGADIKKIGGSLSIVLGGYLGLVWLLRKVNPAGNQGIPTEVLEVVGNAPLDNRQNLQLVRLGSKLLLMIHGPDGTQPIGEVTDPAEVDHLVSLCNGRTKTANSAINNAVSRHQSNIQAGGMSLNLSANQQNNLTQLLSVLDQSNRGITARSFEA